MGTFLCVKIKPEPRPMLIDPRMALLMSTPTWSFGLPCLPASALHGAGLIPCLLFTSAHLFLSYLYGKPELAFLTKYYNWVLLSAYVGYRECLGIRVIYISHVTCKYVSVELLMKCAKWQIFIANCCFDIFKIFKWESCSHLKISNSCEGPTCDQSEPLKLVNTRQLNLTVNIGLMGVKLEACQFTL